MRRAVVLALGLAACGRIGYDEGRTVIDAPRDTPTLPVDAAPDGAIDAAPDAAPVCPLGAVEITTGSTVCIEVAQRGVDTWTAGKAICEGLGRRLCADAEWATGCVDAPGLMNMLADDWEWVAEESAGVAWKRGGTNLCADMSTHVITDPYGYRCCADKL